MESSAETLGVIKSDAPARLDRLPWSRFHWMVVAGLGTVWILDGIEVTIVGAIGSRLTEKGSGLVLTAGQVGTAAAIYVTGACLGALFFGRMTDRFGRKKLFLLSLGLYIAATLATAFSMSPLYFFIARFFTGAGIGGEYAAINSAIDELIPARVRGRVDLIINGSYWMGAALGGAGAIFLLSDVFAQNIGWRIAFGLGAVLGLAVLVVRRNVPESPRWLAIHGREDEANEILDEIERGIEKETGEALGAVDDTIEVKQRKLVTFREIASTAFRDYPKRTALGLALFIGQAFLYNAVTFDLGTLFSKFFGVSSGTVPVYFVIFALVNFSGPVLLGRLFDTVGRRPMVTGTFLLSALGGVALAILIAHSSIGSWGFLAVICVTFFFTSAGASSAYLTVSEIFPLETRAMSIAFFYAIGTAAGGITGPLLFGHLIESGSVNQVAIGFYIGAALMLVGALAEFLFGPAAEGKSLEEIATPLSAQDADEQSAPAKPAPKKRQRGRYRPGLSAPSTRLGVTDAVADSTLGTEVATIQRALASEGPAGRDELYREVGARFWGPGRFTQAVRSALAQGVITRDGRRGVFRAS
jgi:MFS family permease